MVEIRLPRWLTRRTGRRRALRIVAGAAAGLVGGRAVLAGAARVLAGQARKGARPVRIEVTATCVGCTGCVAVCPTSAIEVVPGGIDVIQERCVTCGYCQAGCPVDGIRVLEGASVA